MIHNLDITKWPDATFTKWSALADQTPVMEWNGKVVDPAKVAARSTNLGCVLPFWDERPQDLKILPTHMPASRSGTSAPHATPDMATISIAAASNIS
jgi:hypothetical protein